MGNVRFEKLMLDDVDTPARAEREDWDASRLAKALDIVEDKVEVYQRLYRQAKDIVDAPSPAESFRRGVRYSIENGVREGLRTESEVEQLVTQVCYRPADLGYLLDVEGKRLSAYSETLRTESSFDDAVK
jgi:hypothetical protein